MSSQRPRSVVTNVVVAALAVSLVVVAWLTCTQKTWLVDVARPHPLGGGPLEDPTHHVDVVDYVDPGPRNSLLVKVRPGAAWTLTLTPFDGLALQTSRSRSATPPSSGSAPPGR